MDWSSFDLGPMFDFCTHWQSFVSFVTDMLGTLNFTMYRIHYCKFHFHTQCWHRITYFLPVDNEKGFSTFMNLRHSPLPVRFRLTSLSFMANTVTAGEGDLHFKTLFSSVLCGSSKDSTSGFEVGENQGQIFTATAVWPTGSGIIWSLEMSSAKKHVKLALVSAQLIVKYTQNYLCSLMMNKVAVNR